MLTKKNGKYIGKGHTTLRYSILEGNSPTIYKCMCMWVYFYDRILEYVAMQIAIFRILILGTHDY